MAIHRYDEYKSNVRPQQQEAPSKAPSAAPSATPSAAPKTDAPNSVFVPEDQPKSAEKSQTAADSVPSSNPEAEAPGTPAEETSASPLDESVTDLAELTDIEKYILANPDLFPENVTIDDVISYLSRKKDKTDEEFALLASLKEPSASVSASAADKSKAGAAEPAEAKSSEEQKKQVEYDKLYSEEGTAYQKTSRVLHKYLMENDSKYASLKTEKERQAYRDSQIAQMRQKMGLSKNMSQAQRDIMQANIAKLYIDAGVTGKNIAELKNKDDISNRIRDINNKKFADTNFKFDTNKSAHEQLHDFIDYALSKNDKQYQKLTTKEQKQEYIDKYKNVLVERLLPLGIDARNLSADSIEAIDHIALAAIKTLQSQGKTLESLKDDLDMTDSTKMQTFYAQVLSENKEYIEKIDNAAIKQVFNNVLNRAEIYLDLKNDGSTKKVTDRDIYNKLVELEKTGKLSKEQNALLEIYKKYDTKCAAMLDREAKPMDFNALCIMANKTPEEFAKIILSDKNGNPLKGELLAERLNKIRPFLDADISSDVNEIIALQVQKNMGFETIGESNNFLVKNGILTSDDHIKAVVLNRPKNAANIANAINEFGSDEQKQELQKTHANIAGMFDDLNSQLEYNDNLSTNAYLVSIDAINSGVRKYYSLEQQDAYRNYSVSNSLSAERTTAFTKSYILSGTPEQQLRDAQYFSTVKDPAVTEGMAAAEKHVDSSIRHQYSECVDNAINNNGYNSQEIENINQARNSGQTSYERNAVSSENKTSSSSSTSDTQKSKSASSAGSTNSSGKSDSTNSSSTKTSSASSSSSNTSEAQKVNVSTQSKSAVNNLKAKLSDIYLQSTQASYEHSLAERKKTLDSLQAIIDKIQNDQEVRAQKQAEIAAKEAKTDEETAKAVQEADVKSADEQRSDEAKIVNEVAAELEEEEILEKKYDIPADTIKELKKARSDGDLSKIYSLLPAKAKTHFVQYISKKDTATIIGFIRNRSTDKALIRELCKLNPSLIRILEPDLLESCGIAKADIIKYASPSHLSMLMYDLARTGKTDQLKQFMEALGDDAPDIALNSKPVPGDDRYFEGLYQNMSIASNKVAMRQNITKKVSYDQLC